LSATDKHQFVAGMAAKYGGRLRRFLKLRLSNASDVPDLAQEVFLRLMRVPRHEDIRSPEAYLFTVASHVVHQHHVKVVTAPVSLESIETFSARHLVSGDDPTARIKLLPVPLGFASLPRYYAAAILWRASVMFFCAGLSC
jgi:DNA-directed RNA polymerase specialized sigma24 family protein